MAAVLYRLGRFCFRSRRLVALVWLGIALAVMAAAAAWSGPPASAFSMPGTESQQAFDLLEARFPGTSLSGAEARVVFAAPDGQTLTDPGNAAAVRDVLQHITDGPQVASVASPLDTGLVSPDGTIALAQVTYAVDTLRLTEAARTTLDDALTTGRAAGLTVEAGGTATEQAPELGAELLGVVIAVVVLVVTLGSVVAAGMPLAIGVTGVGIALAAITAAMGVVDISAVTPVLAVMLGLAVGIDYSLLVVSRHRDELASGHDGEESAGRAIGTAGNAVVFACLTVVVALAALGVIGIPAVTQMGLAAAFTVVVAMLAALTLLPALLGFAGSRVLPVRVRGASTARPRVSAARRWVALVTRRPVVTLTVATVGLGALALPLGDLRLGFPDDGTWPEDTSQRRAYDLVAEGFGPGFNGHLLVVVDAATAEVPAAAVEGVATALAGTDGVASVFPPQLDTAGSTAILVTVPTRGPASEATERLVRDIRADVADVGAAAGADVVVTGSTALQIDVTERSRAAVAPYLLVVVGLALVLLVLVFRSLLVPVTAVLGFLLTVAATGGVVVGVVRWGWLAPLGVEPTGSMLNMLPLVVVGVAFGLAMDYQFFLVTRIREAYVRTADAPAAITAGFEHSARVVGAAAGIMIAVFGAFGLLNEAADISQIGIALAVAIALDAFVVRMTMVPAVLALAGERAWWLPRALDRALPDVDVEGHALTRRLEALDGDPALTPDPVHEPAGTRMGG